MFWSCLSVDDSDDITSQYSGSSSRASSAPEDRLPHRRSMTVLGILSGVFSIITLFFLMAELSSFWGPGGAYKATHEDQSGPVSDAQRDHEAHTEIHEMQVLLILFTTVMLLSTAAGLNLTRNAYWDYKGSIKGVGEGREKDSSKLGVVWSRALGLVVTPASAATLALVMSQVQLGHCDHESYQAVQQDMLHGLLPELLVMLALGLVVSGYLISSTYSDYYDIPAISFTHR